VWSIAQSVTAGNRSFLSLCFQNNLWLSSPHVWQIDVMLRIRCESLFCSRLRHRFTLYRNSAYWKLRENLRWWQLTCHGMSRRMDVYQRKVLGMSVILSICLSLSLSLFPPTLRTYLSMFLSALHSIDATDALYFVSAPVYDVAM
jgi:hypothetical protein